MKREVSEAPIYSATRPYEIAWTPGWQDGPNAGRVRVGPHQPPWGSSWVTNWPGGGNYALSVGHSSSWPKAPEEERALLVATALDLLMQGVDPQELQREFWQIEQWRKLRLPLSPCLFLDDGTWSPHGCDSEMAPHNLGVRVVS